MLVIDGCLLGVLGKILLVIYVLLEVVCGGVIGLVCDGDLLCLDCIIGMFENLIDMSYC